MTTKINPIAVFATDEDLLRAVRCVKGTLALSGLELTRQESAMLIKALREGVSPEEYLRWVEDAVFWGRRHVACSRRGIPN